MQRWLTKRCRHLRMICKCINVCIYIEYTCNLYIKSIYSLYILYIYINVVQSVYTILIHMMLTTLEPLQTTMAQAAPTQTGSTTLVQATGHLWVLWMLSRCRGHVLDSKEYWRSFQKISISCIQSKFWKDLRVNLSALSLSLSLFFRNGPFGRWEFEINSHFRDETSKKILMAKNPLFFELQLHISWIIGYFNLPSLPGPTILWTWGSTRSPSHGAVHAVPRCTARVHHGVAERHYNRPSCDGSTL